MTAAAKKRYTVFDRQRTIDAALARWSAVNPRYWVIDSTTGVMVDEYEGVVAARMAARYMNDIENAQPLPAREDVSPDPLLDLTCGHRADERERRRYGPDAWCGECCRWVERRGRVHPDAL